MTKKQREEWMQTEQQFMTDSPVFAAMNYRERGAVDGYASFDGFGNPAPTMSVARIMQLLGCGKPQVG